MSYSQKEEDEDLRGSIEEVLESLLTEQYGSSSWVESYRVIEALIKEKTLTPGLQKKCEEIFTNVPKADPSRILAVQTGLVDLAFPLSEYCENLASSSPIKYRIQGQPLRDDEVFAPDCTLPIFLFLAKELSPKNNDLRLYHYHDGKAVLEVWPIVPAAPDSSLFDTWKGRLNRVISSLEEAAKGDYVDLDQYFIEWERFIRSSKRFPGWHLLINFIREEFPAGHGG